VRLDRPTLAATVAVMLALYTVGSLVENIQRKVRHGDRPDRDMIPLEDARFAELGAALPARGVVGYVSDSTDPSNEFDLFRTQYELAPRVLVRGERSPLVVGKFGTESALTDACARERLAVAKDLGGGLYLLRSAP
jgi:hypothetical protein